MSCSASPVRPAGASTTTRPRTFAIRPRVRRRRWPTVTGVSPASGPSTGGTTVTITGTGLHERGGREVRRDAGHDLLDPERHDDHSRPRRSPTSARSTSRSPRPAARPRPAPPTGSPTSSRRSRRSPACSPTSGPSTGGTTVTVTGTGLTGATAVNFGAGNPAIFFTVNSPTSLDGHRTRRPDRHRRRDRDHPGGHVARLGGRSVHVHRRRPPAVTGINPASGPAAGGTWVQSPAPALPARPRSTSERRRRPASSWRTIPRSPPTARRARAPST